MAKCCKCDKPGMGIYKGKVYCTKHLLEAMKKNKEEKK